MEQIKYLSQAPEIPSGFGRIVEFPNYCIDRIGTVYSCRTRGGKFQDWTPMTTNIHPNSRAVVTLRLGKSLHTRQVHALLLEAFVCPRPPGMVACHNDSNPLNNALSNLRWDTPKGNMHDRIAHGTHPGGEKNPAALLNAEKVREIRRLYKSGIQQKQIAPMFSVSKQCIQVICAGETWKEVA